ncbi:MAG: DNA mismatch repair protein MutS [Candidatus Marinimicrobia bacterium]|nr:DNA mismatch repair protein MutS [Candidatus Neomarinimicrobiota bacterium]
MSKNIIANTPVMKQFLDVKTNYPDTLVLFRMGDFYETFLEDAVIASKILGIVLTKRSNGKASDVDLAGFPYHAIDNYLPKLVKAGYRVAICEQLEDSKFAKGIVKRDVVEVVTPGTLTADKTLNDKSNRFIGSLCFFKNIVGLSFLDSSTGEFYLGECKAPQLNNTLLKFSPQEIVISDKTVYSNTLWYKEFQPFITQIEQWNFDYESAHRLLTNHFNILSLKSFGCDKMSFGISAAGALVHHLKSNLSSSIKHITKLIPIVDEKVMTLDSFTIKNLEVFNSLSSQGAHGTLIDCIDETLTAGGGRLLRKNLINPSTDIQMINNRLNIVENFVENPQLIQKIRKTLYKTSDIQRVLAKLIKGKASPRDIFSLACTLEKIPKWQELLSLFKSPVLNNFSNSFLDTNHLWKKIKSNLNETSPIQILNGNTIKNGVNEELDELRKLVVNGKEWMNDFRDNLRKDLDIPKLKIGYNKVFGFYIEVTKVHQNKIPKFFIRKQTLTNSERYITEELKEYEEKVVNAEEKIVLIELRIFNEICDYIISEISNIQKNALVINALDLHTSFAFLAISNHYIKPLLISKPIIEIKNGRHPVVENLLPVTEKFISNSTSIDADKNQIHLLTGPNMAGKSTYLRQVGLIVIMAQIGCFVPATKAKIGIVDRLFTRVGASDNLAGGESTFMVEMNEAANILNNATKNSLILLDEIGRGTSTYDGMSIACAITEFIHNKNSLQARTIFATHYHELTELEDKLERLENYHVEIKEFKDTIIFLRSIVKGVGDKSYGIQVAKMAGLPNFVINRASEILKNYIDKYSNDKNNINSDSKYKTKNNYYEKSKLFTMLNSIDINKISPLEALKILDTIKKEIEL